MLKLSPHPTTPPLAELALTVSVKRKADQIDLSYVVTGDINAVRFPAATDPARTDELWKTTCFEAFAKIRGQDNYIEYNFAPSGQWAAYSFSSYRDGMADWAVSSPPVIERRDADNRVTITNSAQIPADWIAQNLLLNLTAVIEEKDGTKSYWALKHPNGPPDFHDPACILLSLKAPDAA